MAERSPDLGSMTEARLLDLVWDWAEMAVQPIATDSIARRAATRVPLLDSIALRVSATDMLTPVTRWPPYVFVLLLLALLASFLASALLVGSPHRDIAEQRLPPAFGPARNGAIVMSSGSGEAGKLVEVDPATGVVRTLREGAWMVGPEFSNDGRRLMFGEVSGEGTVSLWVMSADGSGARKLGPDPDYVGGAWAPDGHRLAAARGQWLSIRDIETSDVVRYLLGIDIGSIQWRPNHDQVFIVGTGEHPRSYLVNGDGSDLRQIQGELEGGIWSPDGSTIAYGSADGRVHVVDVDSGVDRALAFDGSDGTAEGPEAFSPDGTKLLIRRALLGKDIAPPDFPRDHCCREPWLHVVVPTAGGGPAVVLGPDEHKSLGGPGGGGIFSPDGTLVLAAYTMDPVGVWLFDTATGQGERQPWANPAAWQGVTWQRLAP